MIKRIYLDLDDVLNKFTMPALSEVGCDVNPDNFNDYKPEWGWDIVKAANELPPPFGPCESKFTTQTFWDCIKKSFWACLPTSDEFDALLETAEQAVGRENVFILSSPVLDPECLAGKVEWIYEHCPKWLHRQYLIGPPKHCCARLDALLIDDSDKNVDEFHKAGGHSILMPRPWNSAHYHAMSAFWDALACVLHHCFRETA